MPVTWAFRGSVLTLALSAVVTNEEIERAIGEAVANAPRRSAMQLLWDARESQTPVSSDDIAWRFELVSSLGERGILSRVALLLRNEHRLILEIARQQLPKALRAIECEVFTDASQAAKWLEG
jgi:hypothetical protein